RRPPAARPAAITLWPRVVVPAPRLTPASGQAAPGRPRRPRPRRPLRPGGPRAPAPTSDAAPLPGPVGPRRAVTDRACITSAPAPGDDTTDSLHASPDGTPTRHSVMAPTRPAASTPAFPLGRQGAHEPGACGRAAPRPGRTPGRDRRLRVPRSPEATPALPEIGR